MLFLWYVLQKIIKTSGAICTLYYWNRFISSMKKYIISNKMRNHHHHHKQKYYFFQTKYFNVQTSRHLLSTCVLLFTCNTKPVLSENQISIRYLIFYWDLRYWWVITIMYWLVIKYMYLYKNRLHIETKGTPFKK